MEQILNILSFCLIAAFLILAIIAVSLLGWTLLSMLIDDIKEYKNKGVNNYDSN